MTTVAIKTREELPKVKNNALYATAPVLSAEKTTPELGPKITSQLPNLIKTYSNIINDIFSDMQNIPSISQPAATQLPEMYMAHQIELEQEKTERRMEDLEDNLKEKKEEKETEETRASHIREPEEILERITEMQEDMEGVMEVVEKIRVVNETGRVVSERTVARHRRVATDVESIIDRAGKYGVEKEEVIAKLGRVTVHCKIPQLKEQLKEILEEGRGKEATKESISSSLGKIVIEEKEKIAKLNKQSSTDRKRITAKVQAVIGEQKGYEQAIEGLLKIFEKAKDEKYGKEDLLKELIGIAGGSKQGIGKELQEILGEAKKDERNKQDVISDLREAAGRFLRKLAVIEAVGKSVPAERAAEMQREEILKRMQGILSAWKKQQKELEEIEKEMQKLLDRGIGGDEFKKASEQMLASKKDILREVERMKPADAVKYVRGMRKELQENEHIQDIEEILARPLGKDELVEEINGLVRGESEAVQLSKKITAILKKAEDEKVKTQDLVKELRSASRLAEASELNARVREILQETEKRGMSKDFLVGRLREIAQEHERQIEIAAGVSLIISESEKLTKKEIVDRVKNIVTACRREADFFEKTFKILTRILAKKPSNEEFFGRLQDELQGREWVLRDIEKRKLNPGQATEAVRELAEGLMQNPYVRKMDALVKKEQGMRKVEVVGALQELDKEIKQTKHIITELKNLADAAGGKASALAREDVLIALDALAKSTSSNRLGRKLARMADRARKEGLTKEDLLHEIRKVLPSENNILTIFSQLRIAMENDDSKEVNRLINILYQVNSEILSVDIAVRKAMQDPEKEAGKVKQEIAETARKAVHSISSLSHKEEEREASKNVDRLLENFMDEQDTMKKARMLESIAGLCLGSRSSIKTIVATKFERFLRDCPLAGQDSKGVPNGCPARIARICLGDKDCNTKVAGTKLLSKYFDFLSDHAWKLDQVTAGKHIDESVNALISGALTGPDRLKLSALNALRKVAVRNSNASQTIKKLAKDRSPQVSERAKEIIRELML